MKKSTLILSSICLICFVLQAKGQWVSTGGPEGGNGYAFANRGDTVFVGTNGGVYLSTDNGLSWKAFNTGIEGIVNVLCISGESIFAGTSSGVFRSTTQGGLWTRVNNGLTHLRVHSIAVQGDTIFIVTDNMYGVGCLYRSTNNGSLWSEVQTDLPKTIFDNLVVSNGFLFVATSQGVFRSTNNGANWTLVTPGLLKHYIWCIGVKDTTLFASIGGGGMLRSTDNGSSWSPLTNSLSNTTINTFMANGNTLFAGAREATPADTRTGALNGVFLSTDNGSSWISVGKGLLNTTISALTVSGSTLLAGTAYTGIYRSTDNGLSWMPANTGLLYTTITSLEVSGTDLFAGLLKGGVYLSTNNGASWQAVNSGLIVPDTNLIPKVSALVVSSNTIFAYSDESLNRGVYRSTNKGSSWTLANTGLSTLTGIYALAASSNAIFASTHEGVFCSMNNGSSWTLANTGLPQPKVEALTVSGSTIFASITGGAAGVGGIYSSTDNGSSWSNLSTGLPRYEEVLSIVVSDSAIFAGTSSKGIYRSTNNGLLWTEANTGLPSYLYNVTALVENNNNIFAGTYKNGVYLSTNNGTSWTAVNTGLPKIDTSNITPISSLVINGNTLFAGTKFNSIWCRPLSDMLSTSDNHSPNQQTNALHPSLHVNASGYMHSDVRINYSLSEQCFVQLEIHSIAGKKVAEIKQSMQLPGEYTIRLKEGLSAGLYIVSLQGGSYQKRNMMRIIR